MFEHLGFGRRRSDGQLKVRLATFDDLPHIANLDVHKFYGSTIDLEGLRKWFRAYPRGAYVLEDRGERAQDKIIGAFGFWPVTYSTYRMIVDGEIAETQISPVNIHDKASGPPYRYWYFADALVSDEGASSDLSWSALFLLHESFGHWLKFRDFEESIDVCALAPREDQESTELLLERFEFRAAESLDGASIRTKSGDAVYLRSFSASERKAFIDKITRLYRVKTLYNWMLASLLWTAALASVGVLAFLVQSPQIFQLLGIKLEQWILQLIGITVCALALLLVRNRDMRMAIIVGGVIPIVLKLFKMV